MKEQKRLEMLNRSAELSERFYRELMAELTPEQQGKLFLIHSMQFYARMLAWALPPQELVEGLG